MLGGVMNMAMKSILFVVGIVISIFVALIGLAIIFTAIGQLIQTTVSGVISVSVNGANMPFSNFFQANGIMLLFLGGMIVVLSLLIIAILVFAGFMGGSKK